SFVVPLKAPWLIRTSARPWGLRAWRGARAGKQNQTDAIIIAAATTIGRGLATGRSGIRLAATRFPQNARGAPIARPAQTIHRASRRTMRITSVPAAGMHRLPQTARSRVRRYGSPQPSDRLPKGA